MFRKNKTNNYPYEVPATLKMLHSVLCMYVYTQTPPPRHEQGNKSAHHQNCHPKDRASMINALKQLCAGSERGLKGVMR